MPPRLPLQLLKFPATLSFFPFSRPYTSQASSSAQPKVTRYLLRTPSQASPRESPTPLIFVRATLPLSQSDVEGEEEEEWEDWSSMFAEKGYTSLELDLSAPVSSNDTTTTTSPLGAMTTLLASQIRLLAIPFPPVLVSSGMSCLLTQAYVEDNPASGLILVNPPPDLDPRKGKGREGEGAGEGWAWPVFGFEPRFPILVMGATGGRLVEASKDGVGRGGKGVSVEELMDGPRGERSRINAERWLDRCGF